MTDSGLIDELRREIGADAPVDTRARRAAELIRAGTGRRWVGIYRVTGSEVRNLGWSGPAPPAYATFPADEGLTGAAVRSGSTVVSNDVATDPRYLTNQDTTGSELIVPILLASAVVGTLDIEDPRANASTSATWSGSSGSPGRSPGSSADRRPATASQVRSRAGTAGVRPFAGLLSRG